MQKAANRLAALALAGMAGLAMAGPRIVSLGEGVSVSGLSADGTKAVGASGGQASRFVIADTTISTFAMPGSEFATHVSGNGLFATGLVFNSAGLGGLPTESTLTARWSQSSGTWTTLGLFPTPPGSGDSGGSIHHPLAISSNGRFVVGQGYINDFWQFRGYVWDAQANAGLGEMTVLPTSPEDGRALAVSADGSVVLGGSSPNTGAGRAIVYRLNSGTGEYVGTVLPNGIDPTTSEPYGMFVDSMHMNDSGTIIVGNSFEYDATLEFPLEWLTRWTWNSTTQQWDRTLLATGTAGLSTWWNDPFCPIPPSLIPTGMTADSTRIVGILVYPTCGSFIRGGFIYDGSTGQLMDLYDRLQSIGTSGLSDFSPREPQNSPPRLGWPVGISADGSKMVGYGGPQSGYGPAWAFDADNSNCVPVFVARNPDDTIFSRCASVILNAGAGGSGPISYVWTRNGQPITDGLTAHGSTIEGASTSRLLINNPHPADAGAYACIVTGACGTVTTSAATVSVDPSSPPVANDTCSTAQTIGEGSFTFNPCGAFNDDGVEVNCQPGTDVTITDMWYRYVPTFTGDVRISTCGSTHDTIVTAFNACGGTELACNDDFDVGPGGDCWSSHGRIGRLAVQEGVPVWIRVAGHWFVSANGMMQIEAAPAPVANDTCFTAATAVLGANTFDTTEATADTDVECDFSEATRDVWFTFTAPSDGVLNATTCGGTEWDTVLSIHDGCGGTVLACNNDTWQGECGSQSTISRFAMTAGQIIKIRVGSGWSSAFGTGTLHLSYGCAADFNADTVVDLFDYLDFVAAFSAQETSADFNNDTVIDFFDYLDFVSSFAAGCGN